MFQPFCFGGGVGRRTITPARYLWIHTRTEARRTRHETNYCISRGHNECYFYFAGTTLQSTCLCFSLQTEGFYSLRVNGSFFSVFYFIYAFCLQTVWYALSIDIRRRAEFFLFRQWESSSVQKILQVFSRLWTRDRAEVLQQKYLFVGGGWGGVWRT